MNPKSRERDVAAAVEVVDIAKTVAAGVAVVVFWRWGTFLLARGWFGCDTVAEGRESHRLEAPERIAELRYLNDAEMLNDNVNEATKLSI